MALSHLGEGFDVTVRHAVWVPPHGSTKLKCARRFRCAARPGDDHGALVLQMPQVRTGLPVHGPQVWYTATAI